MALFGVIRGFIPNTAGSKPFPVTQVSLGPEPEFHQHPVLANPSTTTQIIGMDPPSARPVSSVTKALSIPELVRLIASYNTIIDGIVSTTAFSVDRTDLVRFSQVCRHTFEILVPAIWEGVYGAQSLLRLIESTSLVYDDASKSLLDVVSSVLSFSSTLPTPMGVRLTETQQVLPEPTDRIYERFDFYASHVKYLEVYGANNEAFEVRSWSTLITRSQGHPLLPNLKSILFSRNPSLGHEHDEALWIECFATIGTTEVITSFDTWEPGMFTYAAASRLLEAIVQKCPKVETLALHPWDQDDESDSDSSSESIEVPANPWYQYLRSLPSLRRLSVSDGWLCPPSLQALAQIRTITSLEIHPGDCKGFDILQDLETTNLPSDAFPSLHLLLLKENCPLTTAEILGIRAMVCHVTHLFVRVGPDLDEGRGEISEFGNNLLLMLRNTPNILQLTINCDAIDTAKTVYPIESPAALETMAELPLRAVTLENIHLGTAGLVINLGFIWPNVTVLSMPHQYASLRELCNFASMPRLRRLTILLDLTTSYTPDNDEMPRLPRTPLRVLEGSLGTSLSLNFRVIEHNAEFIARLWPGARFAQPKAENTDKGWRALVALVDHLVKVYTIIHGTDQPEQEEQARGTIEEDRKAWEMRTAGFSRGPEDPWPDYVYGGPDTTFDYIW